MVSLRAALKAGTFMQREITPLEQATREQEIRRSQAQIRAMMDVGHKHIDAAMAVLEAESK